MGHVRLSPVCEKASEQSQDESEDDRLESVNATKSLVFAFDCRMNETGRLQNYKTIIGPTIYKTWNSDFMRRHFQPHWVRRARAPFIKQILVVSSVCAF